MEQFDLTLFDLSPIAMWLQDFSGVKKVFQRWQSEGVTDFEQYLMQDTSRLYECLVTIQTLRVNASTLKLYEANDLEEILASFLKFLTPEVTTFQIKFFCALWNNNTEYTIPVVNYTCHGKQIDVQLRANVVTGYEDSWALLLLTTEHISDYQNARRFAESIFMHSPTALWVKDYSWVKKQFDLLKQQGVTQLTQYLQHHPVFIYQCFQNTRSLQVNQALLDLFKSANQTQFDQQMSQIFFEHHQENFATQLCQLWDGQQQFQHEYRYQTADGTPLFILEQLNIFPDAKDNWDTVQVAYIDLTERKKLEDHLHHVSHYDQLTELHNRNFFNQEVVHLQQALIAPIACIYMDLNGLKTMNDQQGHYFGDLLLQRFAHILQQASQSTHCTISRVGGDEFVILMPYANENSAQQLLEKIEHLIALDSIDHPKIQVASGISSLADSSNMQKLVKIADQNMYQNKQDYYNMVTFIHGPSQ